MASTEGAVEPSAPGVPGVAAPAGPAGAAGAVATPVAGQVAREILPALALAQFMCSYANTALNVSISDITLSLGTTVTAVQTAITVFTLVMAALMIPGSKLSDIFGRKRAFLWGIGVFALGACAASLSQGMGLIYLGFSLGQGVGTALLIPPVYILVTVMIDDLKARAAAFGVIGGAGALGSATGPLLGGLITTALSWRVTFLSELLLAVVVVFLARRIRDPGLTGPRPTLDVRGAVLSALGLVLIVAGLLTTSQYGWLTARQAVTLGPLVLAPQGGLAPVWLCVVAGLLVLALFYLSIRAKERRGQEPLVHTHVLRNRVANLGLVTQWAQWFMLIGGSFVISVYLQIALAYSAIQTGLFLLPFTVGLLVTASMGGRLARRHAPRTLLRAGFGAALVGVALLLLLADATGTGWRLAPGLLVLGLAQGVIITPSVNVVQSALPERDQGELSGVSRSVSNLGSSFGTAVAGGVLVSAMLLIGADLVEQSALPPATRSQIAMAMQGDVSAVSNAQVEAALAGQPQALVDEVVRINATARNTALALALASIGLAGLIGLAVAFRFPAHVEAAAASAAPAAATPVLHPDTA
jgi:MFS family permease